jgi:hypothetical protein
VRHDEIVEEIAKLTETTANIKPVIRPVSSQLAEFLRLTPTPASADEIGGSAVNRGLLVPI